MAGSPGRYAQYPYAGGQVFNAEVPPGLGKIPPPIPGGTGTFTYTTHPIITLGWRSYAGRRGPITSPGGGVSIAPDHDNGIMHVSGWWPYADNLQFIRVHADGSRHRVRSQAPEIIPTATRRNHILNPSIEEGLNGYVPYTGNPSLTQEGDAAYGEYVLRSTISASGTNSFTIPQNAVDGQDLTFSFSLRLNHRPSTVAADATWTDRNGVSLGTTPVNLVTDSINRSVDQWSRHSLTIPYPSTAPSGGNTLNLKLRTEGSPAGSYMEVDGLSLESGETSGEFFDGDTYNGEWLGTPGLSNSISPPVVTVIDGECPLDQPVKYEVIYLGPNGGKVVSAPAILESRGKTWLTHPNNVESPLKVIIQDVPDETYGGDRGIFQPIGAEFPVVITSIVRSSAQGEIKFWVTSFEERDELLRLFSDMQPVLIRAPLKYGYGDKWVSLGDITVSAESRRAPTPVRSFVAPYVQVDAPLLATV